MTATIWQCGGPGLVGSRTKPPAPSRPLTGAFAVVAAGVLLTAYRVPAGDTLSRTA
ncbi:hypothetical protein [Nocardia sp. alder85J]|uniref:hypothetical protein n=1 Tax=Nocardia sp. alder85J TaxID=2862949 RepID=UPI001CD53B03|nr:hypothetical protein [Nocardia sp. alder85J]MCX4091922.1 hypothetical protein [Nocardia sp. alder85J]